MLKNSILVVLTAATLTFAGCSKEKKYIKKIEGDWNVTSFTINNNNALMSNDGIGVAIEMDYDEDGDFNMLASISYEDDGTTYNYSYNFMGTWEITDTDLNLEYTNSEVGGIGSAFMYLAGIDEYEYISNESYEIVELTKNKLILEGKNQGYPIRIEAEAD